MRNFFFFLFFLIQTKFLFAGSELFNLKSGNFHLNPPTGWEKIRNFAGIELMLIGPMKDTHRPIVTISSTNFSDLSFEEDSLKKDEATYRSGREKWLEKYNGRVEEFFNYQTIAFNNKNKIHTLGFRYVIGENHFTEQTYYLQCSKKLYHFKFLALSSDENLYKKNIESMLESFSCQ